MVSAAAVDVAVTQHYGTVAAISGDKETHRLLAKLQIIKQIHIQLLTKTVTRLTL